MVNILFCGNSGVFDGMLTCALSILKRTTSREPFTFYVFTMDVSHIKPAYTCVDPGLIAYFDRIVKGYNPENQVKCVDVTKLYMQELDKCPNETAYCSPYTMVRLLADLVPGMPDKLLYLDADIMFNRDVHLLYDMDVTGYEYAAGRDHYGKYLVQPNYVNAGVLLFNMKMMRRTDLLKKCRDQLRRKKLPFADQDALKLSTSKKLMLPQKFNDQKFLHKSTVVRHFSKRLFWTPYPHTENIKQWQVAKVHKKFGYTQFDDILYEYIYLKEKYNREVSPNG